MYKLIVLSPSAGGKSTLMRRMREQTNLTIVEMDEELVRLNNGKWPFDNVYRNSVLVPKVSRKVLGMEKFVYLSSYLPEEFAKQARNMGITISIMEVSLKQLKERNKKRMAEEQYESVEEFFNIQLEGFHKLKDKGLIDKVIDGHKSTEDIAEELVELANAEK